MLYFFLTIIFLHLLPLLAKALKLIGYPKKESNKATVSFTIVVAAHNEADNLKKLIPKLITQEYPYYDVMIVLDRCTDGSKLVIDDFVKTHPGFPLGSIEIMDKPNNIDGKKHALTAGIQAAKNEWILLTDADCYPSSDQWVTSFASEVTPNTQILLGVSPFDWEPGITNALIQYETFLTALHYLCAALYKKPYMGVGRNLAYRKSLFINTGGYGDLENITGGDDDLFIQKHSNSINTKIILGTKSLTYSAAKRTLNAYFVQKTRHLSVGKYYRSKLKLIHSFRALIHLLVWLSFLYLMINDPSNTVILGSFCSMLIIEALIFTRTASKLGVPFSVLWFPIIDFLYAVLLPLVSIQAVLVKKIRWK